MVGDWLDTFRRYGGYDTRGGVSLQPEFALIAANNAVINKHPAIAFAKGKLAIQKVQGPFSIFARTTGWPTKRSISRIATKPPRRAAQLGS